MKTVELLATFGVPSIFAILCAVVGWLIAQGKKISVLMKAVQSQMRSDLLKDYYMYKLAGVISSDDLDDWENRYKAYHSLGENGVLDKRREELLNLPSRVN